MILRVNDLHHAFKRTPVLRGVHLRADPSSMIGLVGPNGSGKTTVLRACYRALDPDAGELWIGDDQVSHLGRREVARRLGVAVQEPSPTPGLTVRDAVALGRTPHRAWYANDTTEDRAIVEESLIEVGLGALADRDVSDLSGGERQRVSLARALSTRAAILLLDEPTNHLDLHYQLSVLNLLRKRAHSGHTVLLTVHDLRLAAETCDEIIVLHHGTVAAAGKPGEVLTENLLREVFGVRGSLVTDDDGVRLIVRGLA
ncbi:ABC transporter ATP-binding protein [Enemella sp. A6]|uniref:ABC transporter ATP-binding protein n=1 Tax=Enemella sp. A6 TaxID=3440152 RepID=UPI003EB8DBFB